MKPERHAGFVYRDSLWRGADLVGTGVASFGHFQGVHYQNLDTLGSTTSRKLDAGELPINRALPINDHQRLIREMILQLKTGKLDAGVLPQEVRRRDRSSEFARGVRRRSSTRASRRSTATTSA